MKFELPMVSRLQFVGALSALRILLENEDVFGNVITGTVFESLMADMARMEAAVEDNNLAAFEVNTRRSNRLCDQQCQAFTPVTPPPLPDAIENFTESLVMLSLYPVLDHWTPPGKRHKSTDDLDEEEAKKAYGQLLDWIASTTCIKRRKPEEVVPSASSSTTSTEDSEDDEDEDEDEDDEDDDDNMHITMSRTVESAAERLGETRRKGEELDSTTVTEDVSTVHYSKLYAGFASRSLMVLRSTLRYGRIQVWLIGKLLTSSQPSIRAPPRGL